VALSPGESVKGDRISGIGEAAINRRGGRNQWLKKTPLAGRRKYLTRKLIVEGGEWRPG